MEKTILDTLCDFTTSDLDHLEAKYGMAIPPRLQREALSANPVPLNVEISTRSSDLSILQFPQPSPPPTRPLPPLPSLKSQEYSSHSCRKQSGSGFRPALVSTAEESQQNEKLRSCKSRERLGRMPPPVPNADEPWLINPGRYRHSNELPNNLACDPMADDHLLSHPAQALRQPDGKEGHKPLYSRFLVDDVFAPDAIMPPELLNADTATVSYDATETQERYPRSSRILRQASEETMRPSTIAVWPDSSMPTQRSPVACRPSKNAQCPPDQQIGGQMRQGDSLNSLSTSTACSDKEPNSPQGSVTKRYVVERRHLLGMEKPRPGHIIAGRADAVEMDAGQMAADAMRNTSWERAPPFFPLVPVTTLTYFDVDEERHQSAGNERPQTICCHTVRHCLERIKLFARNTLYRFK